MKAIVYEKYGPPEVLHFKEVEKPAPKKNEVLIKIIATTLHRGDVRMRRMDVPGSFVEKFMARVILGFNAPKRKILGMELSGIIESIGTNVTRFKPGDQVFASTFQGFQFGAHAEYICMKENGLIALKPENMSHEEAAPIPSGATAALIYLRDTGKVETRKKVLINGASGSLGTFGIQIAKYYEAEVTGVCSTANIELVKSIGADHVIDYTVMDFTEGDEKYDLIFDAVSMSSKAQCQKVLNPGGSYIQTTGPDPTREDLEFLKEIIEAGHLKTVIDRRYPFDEIIDAHRYVETGRKRGNVIITME